MDGVVLKRASTTILLLKRLGIFQKLSTSELISRSSSKKTNPELTSEQIVKGFVDCDGNTYLPVPIDNYKSVFYVFEECVTVCGLIQDEEVRPLLYACANGLNRVECGLMRSWA
jgi:hypothetical protein